MYFLLQVMKKNISKLLTVALLLVSLSNAQTKDTLTVPDGIKNITVNFSETSLKDALIEIADKGHLKLNYLENTLPQNKKINLRINNKSALVVLKKVLLGSGLYFKILKNDQVVILRHEDDHGAFSIPVFTISGYISEAESGEALVGANIFVPGSSSGCATNKYGFYSMTLNEGIYQVKYSYLGYEPVTHEIELSGNVRNNITMNRTSISSDTVTVTASLERPVFSTAVGTIDLFPEKLEPVPILFGEQDLLKTMHLLPGVASYREGDGGLYIRGGNSDENLLLLDEAPVFNPYHFFGFFSVFNSEAIKNVKLIKGAAPARYGGRISSVIDIQLKEGNIKHFQGSAGLGLIFSRLTLQGPLFNNNGSYALSGRRTYLDLFKYLSGDQDLIKSQLYFYDFNAKANYKISDNDRLYVSGYLGNDVMGFSDEVEVAWGNKTATFRWNHLFSNQLFLNTSIVYSNFTHHTIVEDSDDKVDVLSQVNDLTFKWDFQYFLNDRNTIQFGADIVDHKFLPADLTVDGDEDFNIVVGKRNASEMSLYLSNEYKESEKLKINLGMRFTLFSVSGESDVFDFQDSNPDINIDFHGKESEMYAGAEPRLSATFLVDDINSLKLGYARNYQYIHLVSNSNSGTPLDIWQPVSKVVKPMVCDQLSFGYFTQFENWDTEFSAELFYKKMNNLIDYKDGANIALRTYFESEYVFGKGSAYGLEIFLKKRTGRLTGWLGYTLSRSERTFPDINNGNSFPAKFDRTHDLALVLMYDISKNWNVSANWVYATGNAITIPYGKYELGGKTYEAYSSRNAYRIPAYHRLDLSLVYTTDAGNKWAFSLYNAYGKRNAYTILFRNNDEFPGSKEAVRLSLFSMIPSITYSMYF